MFREAEEQGLPAPEKRQYNLPDKPNSRMQKCRLTEKGKAFFATNGGSRE
jgi:hypothetical protein